MYHTGIIGAGPIGLSCAIELKKNNLSHVIIDKGYLVNSIYNFPQNMTFFSTPEHMEIGDIPFIPSGDKPKRVDAMKYYSRVADYYNLNLILFSKVDNILKSENGFIIQMDSKDISVRNLILATGYYDNPNMLNVSGENLSHVSHYYTDPHRYIKQKVVVIGANNSAVEAVLELYRYGVDVTLVHRGSNLGKGIKYWVLPDIQNRIDSNEIPSLFDVSVVEVKTKSIILNQKGKIFELPADFILALTGYHPDFNFMSQIGIKINEKTFMPEFNPSTGETNISGLYIAGSLQAGRDANKIFIENGKLHGKIIADAIKSAAQENE